jgi:predicted nucleic acid-binding protein
MKPLRIYPDTSVYGGCFDAEFRSASEKFFQEVREGRFGLVISDLTNRELIRAPEAVRNLVQSLPQDKIDQVETTPECWALQQAYLDAEVVGPRSADDALHIAIATFYEVDMVVSWNFKHIVHFDKIAGFESVNLLKGYRTPRIYSPMEVIEP